MKIARWNWIFSLLAVVLAAGCGGKEQRAEPIPTPEVERPAFDSDGEDAWIWPESGLKEDLPKKDAATQTEYNGMNRMIVNDLVANHQSLFCIDADTGVVYFVNQNKDYYIYRIKDGETELAVAMPAKELYVYGGLLYFMAESYEIYQMGNIKDGDIYCYSPKDGTIELVYAAGRMAGETVFDSKLWVDEEGIYFCHKGREETEEDGTIKKRVRTDSYRIPFGSRKPVEDPLRMAERPGWGDYYLAFGAPVRLISRTDDSEVRELSTDYPGTSYIMGDKLYYLPGSSDITRLSVLDLATGVQEDYSIWEELKRIYYYISIRKKWGRSEEDPMLSDAEMEEICKEKEGMSIADSITATEQYLWMVVLKDKLIRIDRKTKETVYFYVDSAVHTLYTDGEQIYGMCAPMATQTGSMARILVDEIIFDKSYGWEYITVEYLTD